MLSEKKTSKDVVRYPVYLIVADNTDEFSFALRYAARSALLHGARIAVLYVMPYAEAIFMPWQRVSDHIAAETRYYAEQFLEGVSEKLNQYGVMPSLYLRTGHPIEVIKELVNEDIGITKLILAADTSGGSPGPLVSYFTGRGMSEINVPVTIVPNHLTDDAFDHLFEQID